MEQGENQAVLGQGDITLIDASRPSGFTYTHGAKQVSLLLPRHLLEQQQRRGKSPARKGSRPRCLWSASATACCVKVWAATA